MIQLGVDLAWGPNGRTGVAAVDDAGRLVTSAAVRTDDELDAWIRAQGPVGVAGIDAPLVVTNPTGRREAEALIAAAYARYDAGPHPTNLGRPHMDPPRGGALAARHGWSIDPWAQPSGLAVEVYPHAGMVGLAGLGRVLPYKRGAFPERHAAFAQLLALVEGLPGLRTPGASSWQAVRRRFATASRPVDLDVLEDEVDAVFCAHLAWLWATRPGELQVYGDAATGAIVAPPPPSHPPAPRGALVRPAVTGAPRTPNATVTADRTGGGGEAEARAVGVGPWPGERPSDPRFDPELLAVGDTRNVADRYRYWTMAAIVADLDTRRHPFHVAIENWQHDANIGSIVRTANAFLAETVHIVGLRRWNRRGAMVTDRYQHVVQHDDIDGLAAWAAERGLPIVAVDNVPGSVPVDDAALPERCVLLFGQEGPGLTAAALAAAQTVVEIRQYGSTRSINAAAAAAIVMHEWIRRWARPPG